MRVTTYLRVAPTARGYKVQASNREPTEPLRAGYDALPTITFKLVLHIPPEAWNVQTVEATVPIRAVTPIEAEAVDG